MKASSRCKIAVLTNSLLAMTASGWQPWQGQFNSWQQ
jgi:hypothetical protein